MVCSRNLYRRYSATQPRKWKIKEEKMVHNLWFSISLHNKIIIILRFILLLHKHNISYTIYNPSLHFLSSCFVWSFHAFFCWFGFRLFCCCCLMMQHLDVYEREKLSRCEVEKRALTFVHDVTAITLITQNGLYFLYAAKN